MILANIKQNVTDLADEHPETIFYLFSLHIAFAIGER